MKKLRKQYVHKIKSLFPIIGRPERKYIKTMEINIDDYLSDSPNCTLEGLYQEFGPPEDVLNSYYSMMDTDHIIKRIRIAKYLKALVITLIATLVILASWRFYVSYKSFLIFQEEQMVDVETVIE